EVDPRRGDVRAAREPAVHARGRPPVPPPRLRPGDPRGRPQQPRHQARHPDDGRRRHHRRDAHRLRRGPPARPRAAGGRPDGQRPAGARPDDRAGAGRLPRRLHQDPQAALARPQRGLQVHRPAGRRRGVRRGRPAVPQRGRADAGVDEPVVRPRLRRRRSRHRRLRRLRVPRDHRHEQRRQPHRRPRRARRRVLADGLRVVRRHRLLAVPQLVRPAARPRALLLGARPARHRARVGRRHGRLLRLPVVELLARQDLHGRHRVAGDRRRLRRHRDRHPHRAAAHRARRAVRHRDALGDHPDRRLQGDPQARVQHGADPPPLRARRVGGDHRHRPLLDHQRARRRLRDRRLLRRLPLLRPAAV
ncbi:MAG: Phospho-N-acetylmuramoyl-pentapeptide-transferase, partial [uncultured Frankineae bacterium]